MNSMILSIDMLASPQGKDWTRYQLGKDGKQFLDFSGPNERIREYERDAREVLRKYGADALRNRFARDFAKAAQKLLEQDSNPMLRLVVMSRVADGRPVCFEDRSVN